MSDRAKTIRTNAWQVLFGLLVLTLGAFWIMHSELNVVPDDERQCLLKTIPVVIAVACTPLILLFLLPKPFLLKKFEQFDLKFIRRFSKHPYLFILVSFVIPFGLGAGISEFLGLRPRVAHQWTIADYIATILMSMFLLGLAQALKDHQGTPDEIKSRTAARLRKRDEDFNNVSERLRTVWQQIVKVHKSAYLLLRRNPFTPRSIVRLSTLMEKKLDKMTEQIEEQTSHKYQRDFNHLMNITLASFPHSLFAKDVLGEAVFMRTANGETLKLFDEDFPVPAKKTMRFSMADGQKEGHIQLSLSENGSRISTDYIVSNVPDVRPGFKTIAVTFIIDSQKELTLQVKKPLIITRK